MSEAENSLGFWHDAPEPKRQISDLVYYHPGGEKVRQPGECPNCGETFNVVVDLELIFQDHESPFPDGQTVRAPDYLVCFKCGSHLWLEIIKAVKVVALGPIPDPD